MRVALVRTRATTTATATATMTMMALLGVVAAQPTPAPTPVPAPVSAPLAGIGTSAPVRLLAASPDRSWAVLCEARKDTNKDGRIHVSPGFNGLYGDDMAAFLVLGQGKGTPIDDLLAADPAGRYLVIVRGGKLRLLDTTTSVKGAEIDLTARGAYSKAQRDKATGAFMQARFAPGGGSLLYVALRKQKVVVVVRDLASGTEADIDPGPGTFWDAGFDSQGKRVVLEVVVDVEGRKGRLPTARGPGYQRIPSCTTRTVSDVKNERGDDPVLLLAPLTGGVAAPPDGLIGWLGSAMLRRNKAGALLLDAGDGKPARELVKASCKPIIDGLDPDKLRLLVHCGAEGDKAKWLLVDAKTTRKLNLLAQGDEVDSLDPFGRHLFFTKNDADDTTFDLETGKQRLSPKWQRELGFAGARTLVNRGGRLVLLDGASERELGPLDSEYPEVMHSGAVYLVSPFVVDLAQGKLLGGLPTAPVGQTAHVLAVARDGMLLTQFSNAPTPFYLGPLQWYAPGPAPGPGPTP